jgi:hypothetical protein
MQIRHEFFALGLFVVVATTVILSLTGARGAKN